MMPILDTTIGQVLLAISVPVSILAAIWLVAVMQKRRRKSRIAVYPYVLRKFDLKLDGRVEYAQWLHPKETIKSIDQQQVTLLREYVRPGDTVIDVGAHTGDTTIPLALAAGPDGCVFAVEPNPYVFTVLQENAGLNPEKTNIIPLNFAATETDGVFTFHYSDGGYCNGGFLSQLSKQNHGHRQPLAIKGRDLQRYLREHYPDRLGRLSLIKIDTEGYDRQVILSLMGLIGQYQPVIVCEVLKRLTEAERRSLHQVLAEAGYECFKLNEQEANLRGPRIAVEDLCRWPHYDIFALPRKKALAA